MKKKAICLCTLLLVFLLGFYTDSFAYTLDDMVAYADDVLSSSYASDYQKKCALNIKERRSWLETQVGSNYSGWLIECRSTSNTASITLHCWTGLTTISFPSGVSITPNHFAINFGDYRDTAHLNWKSTTNNGSFSNVNKMYFFGLVETDSVLPDDNYLFLNGYNPVVNFFVAFSNDTISLPNGLGDAYVIIPDDTDVFCNVGYIDYYDEYKPVSLTIFRQNFKDPDNVIVNTVSPDDYFIVNGNGYVKIDNLQLLDTYVYELIFESPNYQQGFATYHLYVDRNYQSGGGGGHGFGSGDFSFYNPQIFIQNLLGTGPSGDDPGSGILGGIGSFFRNLFIPRQGFFEGFINDLKTYYSTHFGFIYDSFDLIIEILERIQNIDYTYQTMTLGPYTLPLNDDFELIPEITFDFNDYIENETMSTIHNYYYLIIDGFIIFGLFYLLEREFDRIIADKEG